MTKIADRPKNFLKKMIEDKKKLIAYIKSGDESKKPEGLEFIDPFTLPGTQQRQHTGV